MPDHRGDDLAGGDENPPVAIGVVGRWNELLQIIDAVHLFRRGEVVWRRDQPQAFALRAEQRLLHEPVAFGELGLGDRASFVAIGAGPGPGRGDAGALQEEGGGGFVDAALDGARIVPHRDAELAQSMQHAEIES